MSVYKEIKINSVTQDYRLEIRHSYYEILLEEYIIPNCKETSWHVHSRFFA